MRVLITGHAGFVGRHMADEFRRQGHTVHGIDLANGHDMLDVLRNPAWTSEHVRGTVDLAVHCAAHVKGREEIDGSPLAVATNLALDSIFFRWLELANVPDAIYFSSSAAYPVATQNSGYRIDLSEDMAEPVDQFFGEPDATYGWAKLTGERLVRHAQEKGHRVFVVRPFSGYGEDQPLDYPFPRSSPARRGAPIRSRSGATASRCATSCTSTMSSARSSPCSDKVCRAG